MRDDDALRAAGRTRRVDHVCRERRCQLPDEVADRRRRAVEPGHRLDHRPVIKHGDGHTGVRRQYGHPLGQASHRQHSGGARVSHHDGDALGRILRVERQVRGPGPEDPQQGDDRVDVPREQHADQRPGADTGRTQILGQLVGTEV